MMGRRTETENACESANEEVSGSGVNDASVSPVEVERETSKGERWRQKESGMSKDATVSARLARRCHMATRSPDRNGHLLESNISIRWQKRSMAGLPTRRKLIVRTVVSPA